MQLEMLWPFARIAIEKRMFLMMKPNNSISPNLYLLKINALLDKLSFVPETAKQFEAALKNISFLLGMKGHFPNRKPDGLRSESLVMLYKTYNVCALDLVKLISALKDPKVVKKVINDYREFSRIRNLQHRLYNIKKKISFARSNNRDCRKLEKESSKIEVCKNERGYITINPMFLIELDKKK